MSILIGIWFAVAGALAGLAGLSGMRRVRRLRRDGVTTWAAFAETPAPADEAPADEASGSPRQILIRYTLPDGRVIERICPAAARKAASRDPGQQVLVWYDPRDPQDVLVYGRQRRWSDGLFLGAGLMFILAGAGIAIAALPAGARLARGGLRRRLGLLSFCDSRWRAGRELPAHPRRWTGLDRTTAACRHSGRSGAGRQDRDTPARLRAGLAGASGACGGLRGHTGRTIAGGGIR